MASFGGGWLLCIMMLWCNAAAAATPREQPPGEPPSDEETGRLYYPSQNSLRDVEHLLQRAGARGKLALVVLGANWCHDSRALASRIHQSPLEEVIKARYEVGFVDVGFLDGGRDVAEKLGVPLYYATPTVLIVDPVRGRLINRHDRHQWSAAERISMEDSVTYFEEMASDQMRLPGPATGAERARLDVEIDQFEQKMAGKVERGYQRVGPMLRAYKEGGDVPSSFEHDWEEVYQYRTGIPAEIELLRAQAAERLESGESPVELVFPAIEKYSWEQ
jgi:thiol-disulfide isomerase/thioredoxin